MTTHITLLAILFILTILAYYNIIRYMYINKNPIGSLNIHYGDTPRVHYLNKVIISLTTTPERIEKSKYTIASLLDQSRRVDEIRIYVPEKSTIGTPYKIPKWLEVLPNHVPQFVIKRIGRDLGSSTKVLPAILEGGDNDAIIFVDDDMIYQSDMVKNLTQYSENFPDRAICNQGYKKGGKSLIGRVLELFGRLGKYLPDANVFEHDDVDVMNGFSGCLVKPGFFDKSLLSSREPLLGTSSDVIIADMLNDRGVKMISTGIPSYLPYFDKMLPR